MKFEVVIANIANQPDIEEVVNSANANLRFDSGVAGAIHSAAGPELEDYCEPYAPLPFGAALVMPAFKLSNKYVTHTRAAHYLNDDDPEGVLTKCVYSVVDAANKYAITSIAVPAIGTGVFKFPKELAAGIMAKAFLACAAAPSSLQIVRICVADADTEQVFKTVFFGGWSVAQLGKLCRWFKCVRKRVLSMGDYNFAVCHVGHQCPYRLLA